jgi:type I restriction enzyme S subunit
MKLSPKRLSQLGRVITGKTPSTSRHEFFGGDYQFVTPSDLEYDHYYCRSTERTVTEEAKSALPNQFVPTDAVMFTCIGATIGKCGIAPAECLTNQQINSVVANERTDSKFLYYVLCHNGDVVKGLGGGAATPIVSKSKFEEVEFLVPSLRDQQAIADILSAYDDLIENNRRRMALLEEAARHLYREWFVRLRFPGHEHTRITNGVPEGWERRTLGSIARVQSGFAFKSSTYLESGKHGIVTIKNVHDGNFVTEVDAFLDDLPEKMPAHCQLATGDILLSLTGNIGRTCFVVGDGYLLNQRVAKLVPREGFSSAFTYFTFRESSLQKRIEAISYGVAQQNLSPVKMCDLPFQLPPTRLIRQFSDVAEAVIGQLLLLKQQNEKLRATRDLLLPRLMSGEIAV